MIMTKFEDSGNTFDMGRPANEAEIQMEKASNIRLNAICKHCKKMRRWHQINDDCYAPIPPSLKEDAKVSSISIKD